MVGRDFFSRIEMTEYYVVGYGLVAHEDEPFQCYRVLAAADIGDVDASLIEDIQKLMPVDVWEDWTILDEGFYRVFIHALLFVKRTV